MKNKILVGLISSLTMGDAVARSNVTGYGVIESHHTTNSDAVRGMFWHFNITIPHTINSSFLEFSGDIKCVNTLVS